MTDIVLSWRYLWIKRCVDTRARGRRGETRNKKARDFTNPFIQKSTLLSTCLHDGCEHAAPDHLHLHGGARRRDHALHLREHLGAVLAAVVHALPLYYDGHHLKRRINVQGVPSKLRLGLVDLDFECSTLCPTLLVLMKIWQKRLRS